MNLNGAENKFTNLLTVSSTKIHIKINGEDYEIFVEPSWTLHYVLHDLLGLLGTKKMCDNGECGSCSVILNGRAIHSCIQLAIECDGQNIETIEGIATSNHPLIDSYIKFHAMQCGYCTPGFIVTAKALLDRNPKPTVEEIKEAISGNLCRCGTYPQHIKAIMETSKKLQKKR
jgi:aerobic-type carbon monoxide dehydrogenase small subunit (CoxS/CutS family)